MASGIVAGTAAEWYKSRRTAAFWLTLIGSAFIPAITFLMYLLRPDVFVKFLGDNPWNVHVARAYSSASTFLLPMYVILVTNLIVQIEYRNNTWKQVYASPRTYGDIFFSKFNIVQSMIIGCFVLFAIFLVLAGVAIGFFNPNYKFLSVSPPWMQILRISGKLYLSVLGITAIQYWLSLRIRNYIAPMGIGLALLITSLIIIQWDKTIYFPYAYPALSFMRGGLTSKTLANHEWYGVVWFALVLILAYYDTVRRREKG